MMAPSDRPGPGAGRAGPARGAGGILTIDLDAIGENFRRLSTRLARESGAVCAAVIKADAYGLGLGRVAPVLWRAGCRRFFVALAEEGLALRALLPDAAIHVFNGPEPADLMVEARLVPVLNHPEQIRSWIEEAERRNRPLPAVLHVDSGLNRLGMGLEDLRCLVRDNAFAAGMTLDGVISHLACAEERDHPMNPRQREVFLEALECLSAIPGLRPGFASLANSSGIFLGPDYHFDTARPGAALYGVNPLPGQPNPMMQVVRLQGKILQLRRIDTPGSVGYGATHRAASGRRIATVAVGYGDGYPRSLSNVANATIGGVRVPLVGRVSMDLITFDVTDVADALCQPGALVDLIGPDHPLDSLAREAGTIGYELLTGLGHRFDRHYLGGA